MATRVEMLEEAVEIIRLLWQGGLVTDHGRYYTRGEHPPLHLAAEPPPYISGFESEATALAGRIGDGYVRPPPARSSSSSTTRPKAGGRTGGSEDLLERRGGRPQAGPPTLEDVGGGRPAEPGTTLPSHFEPPRSWSPKTW